MFHLSSHLSSASLQMIQLFAIVAVGYLIGSFHIRGISLGTSGIFLSGLLFGHFGVSIAPAVQTIGLLFFLSSVALSAGPSFFAQLRVNGKKYVLLCVLVSGIGFLLSELLIHCCGVEKPLVMGVMTGAFTTSPGLASAQEVFSDEASLSALSSGYGLIYPVGVVCKVLMIQLIPRFLHADIPQEVKLLAVSEKNSLSEYKAKRADPLGLLSFALTIILGALLGAVTLPLPGGAMFSLGITGGTLIVGLLIGHVGHIGGLELRPASAIYAPAKEIGLILFYAAAGAEGGHSLLRILGEYGPMLMAYGVLLAIVPWCIGFWIARKVLKLPLLSGLSSLSASMTSTPALAMLVDLAGTDDVAAGYAATYPIALITLVLTMQIMGGIG